MGLNLSDYVPLGQPAVKVGLVMKFHFLTQGPWEFPGHVPEPIWFDPGGTDPREMGKIEKGVFIGWKRIFGSNS